MKKRLLILNSLFCLPFLAFSQLLPLPKSVTFTPGQHRDFFQNPACHCETPAAQPAFRWLQTRFAQSLPPCRRPSVAPAGTEPQTPPAKTNPAAPCLLLIPVSNAAEAVLIFSPPPASLSLPPEGYRLTVTPRRLQIEASDLSGFMHAAATLFQLCAFSCDSGFLPAQTLVDAPDFPVRGLMHDVGRNFQSIERLKANLDFMALYKLNTFHWHLTDHPAWRIECKAFPRLNDARFQQKGRQAGSFYRYDEIRSLIRYANERGIQVIPELDMPGHSRYFQKAFATPMYSRRGLKILQTLIHEFCSEIPVELAPVLHIGSDEVHVPHPEAFIKAVSQAVIREGRTPMMWSPGLPPPEGARLHRWSNAPLRPRFETVDSQGLYCADFDPLIDIKRIYRKTICEAEETLRPLPSKALGAVLAVWNDVRVQNEEEIYRNNPVWSSAITLAERAWNYQPRNEADFHRFEAALMAHKNRFHSDKAFVYLPESGISWKAVTDNGISATVTGWSIPLNPFKERGASAVTLTASLRAAKACLLPAVIGFELPLRPSRQYGGIPKQGEWDRAGSRVILNGQPLLPAPWEKPGQLDHHLTPTWHMPIAEVPWNAEELYWLRKPILLPLKAGDNYLRIETRLSFKGQNWICAFLPKTDPQWLQIEGKPIEPDADPWFPDSRTPN